MGQRRLASLIFCAGLAPAALAQNDAPLSAIDWLSQSVQTPQFTGPLNQLTEGDPPVSTTVVTPDVTTSSLDATTPDSVGLISPARSGLPRNLWSGSSENAILALLEADRVETLPAAQDLLYLLLLAEADPPIGAGSAGRLFLMRVDKLLDLGALEPAQALLEAANPDTPALFRRYFDVALLTGTEDRVCQEISARPGVEPTLPTRIFCLARGGDWAAAALTFNTAKALGAVTADEAALFEQFLDDSYADTITPLPLPDRVSPLIFRMREAIGQGLPTGNLPRAFAQADLRPIAGWRSQIEAAERLARNGAISENTLFDLYTARTPAASGGVWDRVAAVQAFDAAITARDPAAVAITLPEVWVAMQAVRAEVPFAKFYGAALSTIPLTGEAAALAYTICMLSPDYEAVAMATEPQDSRARLLRAVATGNVAGLDAAIYASDRIAAATITGLTGAPPADLADPAFGGRLGEALLLAIADVQAALAGDTARLSDALALLHAVGLESAARKLALQALILGRF